MNPNVPPGSNFDLSDFALQEPIPNLSTNTGDPGNSINEESNAALAAGYTDKYFFTAPDGGMEFFDPLSGATTSGSKFPRSELREVNALDWDAAWTNAGTNVETVTMKVISVADHVCIGQIHIASGQTSSLPLIEIFYTSTGLLEYGIESGPSGSEGSPSSFGVSVPLGTEFTYQLSLNNGTIGFSVNGKSVYSQAEPSAWTSNYPFYFKAGNYDQTAGSGTGAGAVVEIYGLTVSHTGTTGVP